LNADIVTDNMENEHVLDRDIQMSLGAQQIIIDEIGVRRLDKIRGT
jgi:hypothetical protein